MTTLDVPASAGLTQSERRRRILAWSAIGFVMIPTALYFLYLLLIAPAQYITSASFAVRGSQTTPIDALGALGISAPTSSSVDSQIVANYINSREMVIGLREDYGFHEAYDRFSLDPLSYLPRSANNERATAFWQGKVRVVYDTAAQATTIQVKAFTPEDSLRLTQGVLTLSENLVNTLSDRAMADLMAASDREIERMRERYEAARERLAEYYGRRYSGVDVATGAQQAMALVGSLDAQLAQKRTELATRGQAYQPDSPQMVGLQREIAALEAERARALQEAMAAPGEGPAGSQIEAQAVLMDYEFAHNAYQAAIQTAETARRQSITDRKYVVAYIPPREAQSSNWWSRLGGVFAVFIGAALLWSLGALIYSIIRDHME